jgi:hypothetical protein
VIFIGSFLLCCVDAPFCPIRPQPIRNVPFGFRCARGQYVAVMTRIAVLALALALAPGLSAAWADAPWDAAPVPPAEAVDCAAARYRGAPLRAESLEGGLVQEIRWRTPAGNVLRLRLTGPRCRFLLVEGVGQTEARILPGAAP